jgi:hypothetical protein
MVYSKHIIKDKIYAWFSSLPSGHPFTTPANILVNAMNFRMCWLDLHEGAYGMLPEFRKNIFTIYLGDDNAFSVTPRYREKFHEAFLAVSMKKIGMTYTNEMKGIASVKLRKLTEIEFLKRKFRFCKVSNRYVAPLRLETIFETCLWTRKRHDSQQITLDNIQWAIDELCLHGKEVFDFYVPKLCKASMDTLERWPYRTSFMICHDFVTNYKVDFY